jgi:hypothetical protein
MTTIRYALIFLPAFAMTPLPANADVVALPSEPAEHPDWRDLGKRASQAILGSLRNAEGAEVEWTQGFEWGSMKEVVGSRAYGWVACGLLKRSGSNPAKVSKRQISALVEPNGRIIFDYAGKSHSSCWTRGYVPPNQ